MVNSVDLRDDVYVLNYCAKHLARERGAVCEPWRFPIVDSHREDDLDASRRHNDVTFIYDGRERDPAEVAVIGTFGLLHEPVGLRRVRFVDEDTRYFATTVRVPMGQVHHYKYVVDGDIVLDPVNPQQEKLDNGVIWSRFITHFCTQPVNFETHEYDILIRLSSHILPFQTKDGSNFLKRHFFTLDKNTRSTELTHAYRLDSSIGVVSFIDVLLAREEAHHLIDYKICLGLIRDVLRQRAPGVDPAAVPRDVYVDLYQQMAVNAVPANEWDYSRYGNPRYFLQLLRRHVVTGAFAHPKYGGNCAGTGWAYLSEKYVDPAGKSLFAWRRAIEPPLGESADYLG